VKWNTFPAKIFPVPAQYEKNVAQKLSCTSTDAVAPRLWRTATAAYLLGYPNTRVQYRKICRSNIARMTGRKTASKMYWYTAIRMAEEVLGGHGCSESSSARWIIFPAKFFPIPAKYENNFARKIRHATTAAVYLLIYPYTRI
jgi:hypothetical protein